MSFKPTMDGPQKSDGLVVPMKSSNETGRAVEEMMEGRSPAKGNMGRQNALRTQSREGAPSALERVRDVARKDKGARFTALFHHVTKERLRTAFFELKRKAHREPTESRGPRTRRGSTSESPIFTVAFIEERTGPSLQGACSSRNRTGPNVRSASFRWKTSSSSASSST
jgi:hypothetical protein